MNVQEISVSELIPYENNPRNNLGAVDAVAESIRNFGFKVPIVIDSENVIVCGHTRLMAAKKLGLDKVPCIVADDLTDEQIKAFRLADNKTAELAEWDFSKLEAELAELADIDMSQFGFEELETESIELDDNSEKNSVVVSINCGDVNNYEEIKERLQNICDEVGAKISVKMQ